MGWLSLKAQCQDRHLEPLGVLLGLYVNRNVKNSTASQQLLASLVTPAFREQNDTSPFPPLLRRWDGEGRWTLSSLCPIAQAKLAVTEASPPPEE